MGAGGILEAIVAAGGTLWAVALALTFVAVIAEGASSGVGPDGGKMKRGGVASVLMAISALLAPGLLFAHAYVVWAQQPENLGAPIISFAASIGAISVLAAVFGASLIGWLLGAALKGAKPLMHAAALPLSLIALALALVAARPSLPDLVSALTARL